MNERRTYEIAVDRTAYADDSAHVNALLTIARDANADFTNVRVTDDSHAIYVTLAFDATATDVARYAEYCDADVDDIFVAVP